MLRLAVVKQLPLPSLFSRSFQKIHMVSMPWLSLPQGGLLPPQCFDRPFSLARSRELAYQIADQFRVFGGHIGLKDAVIVGGMGIIWHYSYSLTGNMVQPMPFSLWCSDMMKQGLLLAKKPHVVIATPGRLADHIQNTDTVSFKKIKFLVCKEATSLITGHFDLSRPRVTGVHRIKLFLSRIKVLDEADRLLDQSFEEDLGVIFDALPSSRQTLLFSATLTRNLTRLKELAQNKPFFWEAPAE